MKLCVAKIVKIDKHPQSHKLKVCQVDDGTQVHHVVCGASNAREGMLSILAPVGSTTPKGLTIQSANLRGVESHGMLCSANDLNIAQEAGIVDLPSHFTLGTPLEKIETSYLSSIPWHQYKLVENFWLSPDGESVVVQRPQTGQEEKHPPGKLLSSTYFFEGQYHYRHFRDF